MLSGLDSFASDPGVLALVLSTFRHLFSRSVFPLADDWRLVLCLAHSPHDIWSVGHSVSPRFPGTEGVSHLHFRRS